jgi:hypothetical protein
MHSPLTKTRRAISSLWRRSVQSAARYCQSHQACFPAFFGDLSSLSLEDSYAGMTLQEAAQDLEALYCKLDSWYVQNEDRPKVSDAASAPEAAED